MTAFKTYPFFTIDIRVFDNTYIVGTGDGDDWDDLDEERPLPRNDEGVDFDALVLPDEVAAAVTGNLANYPYTCDDEVTTIWIHNPSWDGPEHLFWEIGNGSALIAKEVRR
jgi:hypothetical protein